MASGSFARTLRYGRLPALLILSALLASTLTLAAAPGAMAAAPTVSATISGGNLLAGAPATFSVTASNPAGVDGFNLAIFVDMPDGVDFVSSTLGTPVIYNATNPPTVPLPAGIQRWVWEDLSDLPVGGTRTGTITVLPTQPPPGSGETSAPTVSPVGASITATAYATLSGDATYLPVFNGSTGAGGALAIAETGTSTAATSTISVVPLRVSLAEPSPESELERGVHDHTTVNTLTVRASSEGTTDNATLTAYLPAGLEFLGCGAQDNSTVDRGLGDAIVNEYDGAASLTGTPAIAANCPAPASVDTVILNAVDAAAAGVSAGVVYTRVTWALGTVPAGATVLVRYASAVPLQQNTLTWDGALPTAASGAQGSNLDNNNGPSTRQGAATPTDGVAWTTVATISGDYSGVVRTGSTRDVVDSATSTIRAMDLSVLKAVDSVGRQFEVGRVATFTLQVLTSEYMTSSGIVLTDTIPNGLCPLLPAGVDFTVEPGASVSAECEATGVVTGAVIVSATARADGTFLVVLKPTTGGDPDTFELAPSMNHSVSYQALNRSEYVTATYYGSTTSGDSFSNSVEVTGTTQAIGPIAATYPDALQAWDDSSASIASDLTTIDKRVMARDEVVKGLPLSTDPCTAGTFQNGTLQGFRLGDTVCFELRVAFPGSVATRNPSVQDFLPAGLAYQGSVVAAESTAPIATQTVSPSTTSTRMDWTLGTAGAGGDLYVAPGAVFVAHVWASVTAPSNGTVVDKPENLMKYRQQNVDGQLYFLRDQANVEIDPELQLVKGVQTVRNNAGGSSSTRTATSQVAPDGETFASNRDGILVSEGERVTYRIDLLGLPYDATASEVWDLLPAGVTKSAVTSISAGGVALNPADPGYPTAQLAVANQTRSIIMWTNVPVPAGNATLTYDMTVPTPIGVGKTLVNTASIIRYAAGINTSTDPAAQQYIPAGSLDTSLEASANTVGVGTSDTSEVYLANPTVVKSVASGTATNNTASQVVKGEIATSTYSVNIPAYSSVYNGSLTDAINTPANWAIVSSATTVTYPGGTTAPGATSFTIGSNTFAVNPATGAVTFPPVYSNTTDTAQAFTVNLQAYIRSTATAWTHSTTTNRSNTASFVSTGNTAISATAGTRLIEPSPTLTKVASPTTVSASLPVTYTLTAGNAATRPTLFDTTVTDCVPMQLEGVTLGTPSVGTASTSSGAPGCTTGTLITWAVGDIAAGTTRTLTYTATVAASAAGGASYINSARITGYSLASATPDRATYILNRTATVTTTGSAVTKTVDAPTATIGQQRDFIITASIPARVNFYDAVLVDDVPAGMTISGVTIQCTIAVLGDCNSDLTGGGSVLTPSGTQRAWWLGDIAASPNARTITATYTGTVLRVAGNIAPNTLVNSARIRWNQVNTLTAAPATYAAYTSSTTSPTVTATVTLTEPVVSVSKTVQGVTSATVNPGQTFNYAVTTRNTGTSTAFGVTVTDAVPVGVLITGTIPNGGVLTGAGVNGGGTITWTLASLTTTTPVTFTYTGTFADSATLNGAALTNTATVTQYFSHPTGTGYDDDERREYGGADDAADVTPGFPDPVITKSPVGGNLAYIGENKSFTIQINNSGDGPAQNVEVTDDLPVGFGYVMGSATVTGVAGAVDPVVAGDPEATGQTLTWSTLPNIAASATITITYQAVPLATHSWTAGNTGSAVSHTNDAAVTVTDTSGAPGYSVTTFEDDDDAIVTINRANVSLTKTHTGAIVAGANTTWTLTVANAGPNTAVGPIVITDTLPAGATLESISGTGWVAGTPNASNVVTFTRAANLNSGSSSSVQVTVSFPANTAPGTDAENSACVVARTFDADTSDNCDDDPGTVIVQADLELEKLAADASYTAGEESEWTIEVTNNGPSDSQAPFQVTDPLPASLDWTTAAASGTGWVCGVNTTTGVVTCDRASGTLDAGDSLPLITVTADVLTSWTGTLVNTATVTGTTPEPATPGTSNNSDTVTTGSVITSADLGIVKTVDSAQLTAGGTGRYRVEVTNSGPSDALNVIVTDQLPAGLTYAGGLTSATGDTWSCTPSATVTGQVDCTLDSDLGTLPDGGDTWFEFDVDVASSVTSTVTNTATVSSDTDDGNPDNDTSTAQQDPFVQTNISIAKSHATATVYRVGDEVTFTVTVTNDGIADAANVSVEDTLPADVTYARVENDTGWTVTGPDASGVLTLTLDDPLPSGATPVTRSIDVIVVLDAGSVPGVANDVVVTTTTTETSLDDNDATDPVEVDTPNLVIQKVADATLVQGGDTLTYTLTVANLDDDAFADDITVTDVIPADFAVQGDLDDIGGADWTCALTGQDADGFGGTLECELATLAAQTSATAVTYDVSVRAEVARDSITNTATVGSPSEDPSKVDEFNTDDDTVNVQWIDLDAASVCVNNAPWLDYSIDARNVDNGEEITLTWYPDADADGVADGPAIATQTLVAVTDGSPIVDSILWPGAQVDAANVAIAIPGYRVVTASETPDFENLILDPSLPEYDLRAGALVVVTSNASVGTTQAFTLTGLGCEYDRVATLDIAKSASVSSANRAESFAYTLSVTNVAYGATNDVVLSDPIPTQLRVVDVVPVASTDPTIPDWGTCTVTGRDAKGYGGTVECVLDGWLGYGQTAPDVVVNVAFDPTTGIGRFTNVATLSWTDPDVADPPVQTRDNDADVIIVYSGSELLAMTGVTSLAGLWTALGLILAGAGLIAVRRRRSGEASK